jgi:hypothetical protein
MPAICSFVSAYGPSVTVSSPRRTRITPGAELVFCNAASGVRSRHRALVEVVQQQVPHQTSAFRPIDACLPARRVLLYREL